MAFASAFESYLVLLVPGAYTFMAHASLNEKYSCHDDLRDMLFSEATCLFRPALGLPFETGLLPGNFTPTVD